MKSQTLTNALFTKTQQRVLGLLYGAPLKRLYTNEIVRLAAIGRGTVTRELVKLVKAGVLTVSAEKNQKHYQANPECPVYAELVKIAGKLFKIETSKPQTKFKSKQAVRQKMKQPVKKKAAIKQAPKSELEPSIDVRVGDAGQLGLF
jgi:hypothetical protein